ncbi:MAG TPA: hypothetical protein VJX16_11020 [Terriglobales bacterium]|nr:hypothetical protein [Terriglobales bacterium]
MTEPKKKISLLPALTVLFVISYSLMTMLIIEQGDTINSQRWLIKQLFMDSSELTALKGKAFQQQNAEAQAQAKAGAKTQAQTPSQQVPALPQAKENANTNKARKAAPQHPPKPASDITDARRIVVSI